MSADKHVHVQHNAVIKITPGQLVGQPILGFKPSHFSFYSAERQPFMERKTSSVHHLSKSFPKAETTARSRPVSLAVCCLCTTSTSTVFDSLRNNKTTRRVKVSCARGRGRIKNIMYIYIHIYTHQSCCRFPTNAFSFIYWFSCQQEPEQAKVSPGEKIEIRSETHL